MQLRETLFLLPGYELDGFPRILSSADAEFFLSGWVALWHPLLIARTQRIPRWHQVENPPADLSGLLLVLPQHCEEHFSSDLQNRVDGADAIILRPATGWREFQAEIFSRLEMDRSLLKIETMVGDGESTQQPADNRRLSTAADYEAEFAALGYAYLQIQLMTRQLRYTSNLDLNLFCEQAVEAAESIRDGNREQADRMLQACFDSLGQERDHYYSLDVILLDLTLIAPTTLGKSLRRQLETADSSYLITGQLLRQLHESDPESFASLRSRIDEKHACIVGGLETERPHPLMTIESIARDHYRGRRELQRLEFPLPTVHGRMSFGFWADSPALLRRFGFAGAMLCSPSGGKYPGGNQTKLSWESSDGTFLSAVSGAVIDAADAACFLSLGWTIGESLDHHHVPTIVFAHWPSRTCDYFQFLRIITARTPALGKWMLADQYFAETDQPYHQERLKASEFQFNWLSPKVRGADLVETVKRYYELQVQIKSLTNLACLVWQLQKAVPANAIAINESTGEESGADGSATPDTASLTASALPLSEWGPEIHQATEIADSLLDEGVEVGTLAGKAQQLIDHAKQLTMECLPQLLSRRWQAAQDGSSANGMAQLNPYSHPVRVNAHIRAKESFDRNASWHYCDGRAGDDRVACLDVPSLGFVIGRLREDNPKPTKGVPLAEVGGLLRNEFLEAQIDSARGHLKSLHVPAKRGNRLSVMVGLRTRDNDNELVYSEMVAASVRMLTSSNVCGLVRAAGSMRHAGQRVGDFEIDYEVWKGSRILAIEVKLSNLVPLQDENPWRAAYVIRVAWPNEAAILHGYGGCARSGSASGKIIAPTLIDIDDADFHTNYLTGGLAFHRKTESRFLETILAVDGQNQTTQRIGFGVDLPFPTAEAERFLNRGFDVPVCSKDDSAADIHGWLASVDVKNVTVDCRSPLVDSSGRTVGIRLFLTETSGKSTTATIRMFREIESANRVDYLGDKFGKLTATGDQLTISIRSNELVNVDVLWK
ncbi:MAG: hypothetical protein KDB22_10215 [Planctomycetales bacterium]|nr:hypothetical protein [Planctomycetales bacterium]